jgi:hypothetical protein
MSTSWYEELENPDMTAGEEAEFNSWTEEEEDARADRCR